MTCCIVMKERQGTGGCSHAAEWSNLRRWFSKGHPGISSDWNRDGLVYNMRICDRLRASLLGCTSLHLLG